MSRFRFRAHTGPTTVRELTERLRYKGIHAEAGTEHVYGYVDVPDGHGGYEARVLIARALWRRSTDELTSAIRVAPMPPRVEDDNG